MPVENPASGEAEKPGPTDAEEWRPRSAKPGDRFALSAIYNYYVTHTAVTFEEQPVTPTEMWARVEEIQGLRLPFLVAESHDGVIGFAYASRWKSRSAYRSSVETTVYLAREQLRRGAGSALYLRLLSILTESGFHVAIGGIALPNEASIALHEKLGFMQVAHFRQVGFKCGRWVDVGYWQRLLGPSDASCQSEGRMSFGSSKGEDSRRP